MIHFLIQILTFFRPFFTRLGINSEQMTAIVSVKLTIDNRIEKNGKSIKNTKHTLRKQAILMAVIGAFFFVFSYLFDNLPMTLLIFQSYVSITVITSFMMEYSRLLFNSDENSILERFPVNGRTVLCARIISMLCYLYLITFSLSVVPYLMLLFKDGFIVATLFVFSVVANTLFSLLLANLFYIGLMRFLSVGKFQQIITYVQSLLVVAAALSYQFIGQISKTKIDLLDHPGHWLFFTPPAYFMSFPLISTSPGITTFTLTGIGISLTLLLFVVSMTTFSQSYIQQASALDKAYTSKSGKHPEKMLRFFRGLLCHDPLQQAGFTQVWRMTRDNLKFKQSIIPMIIYAVIFNGIPLYQLIRNPQEIYFNSLLFPLYLLPLMCIAMIMTLNYSEGNNCLLQIYQSRPITRPGAILLGSLKAVYIKYLFPFLGSIFLIYVLLLPKELWADLLLAFSFSILFVLLSYRYSRMVFPFSKEKGSYDSGRVILSTLSTMFILMLMGGLHLFLTRIDWGVTSAIVLCWIAIYFSSRNLCSISMAKIESHY